MKRAVGRQASGAGEWGRSAAGDPRVVGAARRPACGFSLLELVVVMSVTILLTGLLLPALVKVRENAHRVICSSNLRQVGLATVMYADSNDGNLPRCDDGSKQELMAAHGGKDPLNWQGFGWLYAENYCRAPEIFYCPSHTGRHAYERYERQWVNPGVTKIYTNYHYAGPRDWVTGELRRLGRGDTIVLATDGLRTISDFNHKCGMNVLQSDNSVLWRESGAREVLQHLPTQRGNIPDEDVRYEKIWEILNDFH
ncbi:MAG: type II secretion system protein [Planctomycetota bacterium]